MFTHRWLSSWWLRLIDFLYTTITKQFWSIRLSLFYFLGDYIFCQNSTFQIGNGCFLVKLEMAVLWGLMPKSWVYSLLKGYQKVPPCENPPLFVRAGVRAVLWGFAHYFACAKKIQCGLNQIEAIARKQGVAPFSQNVSERLEQSPLKTGGKSGPKWPHFSTVCTIGIKASVPEKRGSKSDHFLWIFTIFAPRELWGVAQTIEVAVVYFLFFVALGASCYGG